MTDDKFIQHNQYFSLPLEDRKESFKDNEEIVCGRLLFARGNFFDIDTPKGRKQLYVDTAIGKQFKQDFRLGNIVRIHGVKTNSSIGKPIVAVHSIETLTRAVKNVKEGCDYPELIPFLDAVRNQENQDIILNQGKIIQEIQNYCQDHEITPVFTDLLENMETGLTAKPIVTKENLLLRREFEMPSRAHLIFGKDIYQMGPVFRNEGASYKNRNEFFVANIYMFYKDIKECANFSVKIFNHMKKFANVETEKMELYDFRDVYNEKYANQLVAGEQPLTIPQQWKVVKRGTQEPTLYKGFTPEMVPFGLEVSNDRTRVKDFALIWGGRTILKGTEEITDYYQQEERYKKIHGENFRKQLSDGEKRYLSLMKHGIAPFCSITLSVDLLSQMLLRVPNVNSLRPTITKKISIDKYINRENGRVNER